MQTNIIAQKAEMPTEIQLTEIDVNNEDKESIDAKDEKGVIQASDEQHSQKRSCCCDCFDVTTFRETMAIILFLLYYFAYCGDIVTMLLLLFPQTGGGIAGCQCQSIHIITDCTECWNCAWSNYSNMEIQQCTNFDSKIQIIQLIFPILFGYCGCGWFVNEITIWIRICVACTTYNKEAIKYREQRDRQSDEFVMENTGQYFQTKSTSSSEMAPVPAQKEEALVRYQTGGYDNDIMGLFPCCFQDIDAYHMKRILIINTQNDELLYDSDYQIDANSNKKCCSKFPAEKSAKCCEFPLFMIGFSLSICWLFPFRFFWKLAVSDLYSKTWKRVCWFTLFHLILFDVCWLIFCWFTHNVLRDAQHRGINDHIYALGPYLERKAYGSFAMSIITVTIWLTITVYLMVTDPAKNNNVYSPVRPHN